MHRVPLDRKEVVSFLGALPSQVHVVEDVHVRVQAHIVGDENREASPMVLLDLALFALKFYPPHDF